MFLYELLMLSAKMSINCDKKKGTLHSNCRIQERSCKQFAFRVEDFEFESDKCSFISVKVFSVSSLKKFK